MSGQQRLIQLSLVGTTFLCLLVGVYMLARKRFAKPRARIVKHSVATPPDEALKYWTADKMRDAKPASMPSVDTLDPEKPHQRGPRRASRPPRA